MEEIVEKKIDISNNSYYFKTEFSWEEIKKQVKEKTINYSSINYNYDFGFISFCEEEQFYLDLNVRGIISGDEQWLKCSFNKQFEGINIISGKFELRPTIKRFKQVFLFFVWGVIILMSLQDMTINILFVLMGCVVTFIIKKMYQRINYKKRKKY